MAFMIYNKMLSKNERKNNKKKTIKDLTEKSKICLFFGLEDKKTKI
jgi:hypothetical protein